MHGIRPSSTIFNAAQIDFPIGELCKQINKMEASGNVMIEVIRSIVKPIVIFRNASIPKSIDPFKPLTFDAVIISR